MSVVITEILNGKRNLILHIYVRGDSDISNEVIVDPVNYGLTGANRFFTIDSIQSGLSGFSASLKFEYLADDTLIWAIPEYDTCFDFTDYGGLKDRSNPLDGTGKVLLSTRGLSSGDEGSIVLRLRK